MHLMMAIKAAALLGLGIILTTYIAHAVCPGFMYAAK